MKAKICLPLLAVVLGGFLLVLAGCSDSTPAATAETVPSTTTAKPASTATPAPTASSAGESERPTRTPVPTPTPGLVTQGVSAILQRAGLSEETFLGVAYSDWANLALSVLAVLAVYLVSTVLLRWILPRLARPTMSDVDNRLLVAIGQSLRRLAVVWSLNFATNRLDFISSNAKRLLTDVYFFLSLLLLASILWQLINLADFQLKERSRKAGNLEQAASLIRLSVWGLRLLVLLAALYITLSHFAINVTAVTLILLFVFLVLALAGRDLLADIVSGAIILVDRPFSVGDRIDVPTMGSWGDVVDIGMRSTRILTWDSHLVTVPNSQMGKSQIVNYSLPDPSCYDMTGFVIAYENDVERVGQLIFDAVQRVDGVQGKRPIDVHLREFRETQMLYKIGWWVASYNDIYPVRDRVNRAVIKALSEAGVALPYTKGSVNVELKPTERGPGLPADRPPG